jgi:hypothetical protein
MQNPTGSPNLHKNDSMVCLLSESSVKRETASSPYHGEAGRSEKQAGLILFPLPQNFTPWHYLSDKGCEFRRMTSQYQKRKPSVTLTIFALFFADLQGPCLETLPEGHCRTDAESCRDRVHTQDLGNVLLGSTLIDALHCQASTGFFRSSRSSIFHGGNRLPCGSIRRT